MGLRREDCVTRWSAVSGAEHCPRGEAKIEQRRRDEEKRRTYGHSHPGVGKAKRGGSERTDTALYCPGCHRAEDGKGFWIDIGRGWVYSNYDGDITITMFLYPWCAGVACFVNIQ